jgi:hypothetical protein
MKVDNPATRLLKTKLFTESLVIKRNPDISGSWGPPVTQSKPLDAAINAWVDKTGNEIVTVSTPGMFMQWMDKERITRLVIASVMVTYIPAIESPKPLMGDYDGW